MGLEELLEALERNAREEAERTLAQAHADCERLTGEAAMRTAARQRETLALRERELRAEAARTLAEVTRESRGAELTARAAFLERVQTAARATAAQMETDGAALDARLHAALRCFGDAGVEIRCDRRLVRAVRKVLADRPRASVAVAPDGAGVLVVRAADGSMEVDASLLTLLEHRWPVLALDVMRAVEESA